MITGHGNDGYLFDTEIIADFSSNVNYQGLSTKFKNHLEQCLRQITSYPQANAENLCRALAQWQGLQEDQVLVTNGATEAFYLIAQAYRGSRASILIPSFAEYEDACLVNQLQAELLKWDDVDASSRFDTQLVFFGNPNNPDGKIFSAVYLEQWLKNNPSTVFVVDEAYIDFVKDGVSFTSLLHSSENIILVKSLTKKYAIPGLRLGYLISSKQIIKKINTGKMPWSVNSLAIAAGLYISQHHPEMVFPLQQLLADTQLLIKRLNRIPHITAYETRTHFFLCKTDKGTAADLKHFLVKVYGVLIRDAANFKSLSSQHFRIATQTEEKNELLINGIHAWVNNF